MPLVVVDERGGVDETLHVPFTQFVVDEIFTGRERERERKRESERKREREIQFYTIQAPHRAPHTAYKTY